MGKRFLVTFLMILAFFCLNPSFLLSEALIADHDSAAEFDDVPEAYIELAKSIFRIGYGHTSHGEQIISGMEMLRIDAAYSIDFTYHTNNWSCPSDTFMCDNLMPSDLGSSTWATDTRTALNNSSYNRNMIMWSWCGQVSSSSEAYIDDYLSKMDNLREDYPDVTFVYMTGHLDSSDSDGNLHERNEQIRQHVRDTDGILFDFADIERFDPDENDFLDLGAGVDTDGCQYDDGGNWCTEWCASNTCPASRYCAHSHYLNCYLKGKAFWWMMAKLAGWEYEPGNGDDDDEDGPSVSSGCGILDTDIGLKTSFAILIFLFATFAVIVRKR